MERTILLGVLMVVIASVGIWLANQDPLRPPQIFLEVVLDPEHPGQLLCNRPDTKLVPCSVEVYGNGWAIHFREVKP